MLKTIFINQELENKSMFDEAKEFNNFFSTLNELEKIMVMSYMSALIDKKSMNNEII